MSRFVYGVNPVLEALKAHPRDVVRVMLERGKEGRRSQGADRVAEAAAKAGVRVEDVPQGDLAHRSRSGVHQGVGAELAEFRYAELEDILARASGSALLLLLDGVTDPQNLGALIRSAHAFGANGVVVPKDRAAGVTPASFKAAAGALEHCPLARVTNLARALEQLKEQGIWTVALAAEGDKELGEVDLTVPTALVLGSEGSGVRPLVRKTCDHLARIPIAGQVGSLNVAAAGAVALYEVARQRAARK
ncbi:MAG: 23S rRNA (guanosine(2251)-2'-O)-methyltransferase RlmB [Deltaproteobacteria bacterium]|nr:MAG: 23S rRNA (guanosine(2251)-2'-O)-methyltransferase RlmB [Deltaproteobacteria bacterium]TMB32984.1 MAG: 23S rRNA (guanosine(2251)-2'-O)-methyltransferase RlmB [Deltaproteobacteria bacterium]